MQCALSGESLLDYTAAGSGTGAVVVVTPSGHVCRKDLLLAKLTENGGLDPFDEDGDRPLDESQLIELNMNNNNNNNNNKKFVPPRPLQATSVTALLHALRSEHDAALLELFDTRQALHQTRLELSQALYQNDAAVRVIARLSQERDAARRQALRGGDVALDADAVVEGGDGSSSSNNKKRKLHDDETTTVSEAAGVSPSLAEALRNDIAAAQFAPLHETWQSLHAHRKTMLKQGLVPDWSADMSTTKKWKSWSSDITTGLISVDEATGDETAASSQRWAGVKGLDITLFDESSRKKNKTIETWKSSTTISCLSLRGHHLVWGTSDGHVHTVRADKKNAKDHTIGNVAVPGPVVHVQVHPDGKHVVAACQTGQVVLIDIGTDTNEVEPKIVSYFAHAAAAEEKSPTLTAGALHPDGLLYLVGTTDGRLILWDFQSKTMAATLQEDSSSSGSTSSIQRGQRSIVVSPNGYHVAVAYAGDNTSYIGMWDLRKQKCLAKIPLNHMMPPAMAFDGTAKYFLYSNDSENSNGDNDEDDDGTKLIVVAAKDWNGTPVAVWPLESPNMTPFGATWMTTESKVVVAHTKGLQAMDIPTKK